MRGAHRHVKWLWRELWFRRDEFAGALFFTVSSAALYLLMSWWASTLLRRIFPEGNILSLAEHLLLGLSIFAAASLFAFGRLYLMTRLCHRITAAVREKIFHHILAISPRSLGIHAGGELISTFSNDLQIFQVAVSRVVAVFAPSIVLLICFAGAMAWHSWQLFLGAIVLISPMAYVASYFGRKLHLTSHDSQDRLAILVGRFQEALGGAKEIKSLSGERQVVERFDALNDIALRAQLRHEKMDAFHPIAITLAAATGVAIVIFLSAFLLNRHFVSAETLTAFLVCVALAYSPLQEASHSVGRLVQLFSIMDRFDNVLRLPLEEGGSKHLAYGKMKGAVRFDHIHFAYAPGGFQLEDFCLSIAPGEKVAIVGPSGAGKSTVLDFVPRFLLPHSGKMLIDGEDSKSYCLSDLRREIGMVFQEPILFEATLLENLRFGAAQASLDEIFSAASAAHVDEFAQRLASGYKANIEAGGRNLSVGQRQRIAIARVLLKNPRILLFDEPTSALDSNSEWLVRDAIEKASFGRTMLIVAHRLSTVRDVDRILVLDAGRIVEDGSHDSLFASRGLYYELCEKQFDRATSNEP